MNPDRHRRLTRWFLEAVDLESGEQAMLLRRLAGEDRELCKELESLLEEEKLGVSPALEPGKLADLCGPDGPLLPRRIGPYRILSRTGEGGMGIVYKALQETPIRRTVALKVIKPGLETEKVLGRFESERQTLSMLEHPNIARVYDAGTTRSGRPYFTMEFVDGESITAFCDRRNLKIEERLRLFLQVCDAVHYAHQNAIIHRDIKPSNVLVCSIDDAPIPKVIDFGVAKAISPQDQEGRFLTEAGQLIGTPEYMSPEQATLSPANLDIRADVYSLGALLYELLTGAPPFDPREFRQLDLAEIQHRIRSQEPVRPSVCAGRASDLSRQVAGERGVDPRSLARRLRGDLDEIVLKSLEKERARRYGSASELAADLRRHLADEPIAASRPSWPYRLRRLVRRHRVAAAVVATMVPLLVGLGVALLLQASQVARERDRAEEVSDFLANFYEVPFFVSGRHNPPDATLLLRESARKVERDLADRPLLQARLLHSLGEALRSVGETLVAVPLLERAHAAMQEELGDRHPATLSVGHDLGRAHLDLGRIERAEADLLANLEARREVLGPEHPDTHRSASSLAFLLKVARRHRESVSLYEVALDGMNRSLGSESRETIVTASLLASEYLEVRRLNAAEKLLRATLPRLDTVEPERGMALYNLGCVLALQGKRAEALETLRLSAEAGFGIRYIGDPHLRPLLDDPEFIRIAKRALLNNVDTLTSIDGRAGSLIAAGYHREAEELYGYLAENVTWEELDRYIPFRLRLADLYLGEGRFEEARSLIDEHLHWLRTEGRDRRDSAAPSLWYLIQAQLGSGLTEEAMAVLGELVTLYQAEPPQHARLAYARAGRESLRGNSEAAVRYLREAADRGFWQASWIRNDRALASVRSEPEVELLVARIERRSEYP